MINFTRASPASFVDKEGTLRMVGVNEPRFEAEGLLFEGDSKNYLTYTTDITTNWTFGDSVTLTRGHTDPMGGSGAIELIPTDTSYAYGRQIVDLPENSLVTFSCWVKLQPSFKDTDNILSANIGEVYQHLTGAGVVREKWTRVHLLMPNPSGLAISFKAYFGYDWTVGSKMLIAFPQVELQDFPTSYIPTTSSIGIREPEHLEFEEDLFNSTLRPATYSVMSKLLGEVVSKPVYPTLYNFNALDANNVEQKTFVFGFHNPEGEKGYAAWVEGQPNLVEDFTSTLVGNNRLTLTLSGGIATLYTHEGKTENPYTRQDIKLKNASLGGILNYPESYFYGHFTELMIWDVALSEEQVRDL